MSLVTTSLLLSCGGPQRLRAGDKIRSGPQVGLVTTSPLPSGESPNTSEQRTNQQCEVFLFFCGVSRLFFFKKKAPLAFFFAVGRVSKKRSSRNRKSVRRVFFEQHKLRNFFFSGKGRVTKKRPMACAIRFQVFFVHTQLTQKKKVTYARKKNKRIMPDTLTSC